MFLGVQWHNYEIIFRETGKFTTETRSLDNIIGDTTTPIS